jgi:hypothetical protein
MEAEDGDVYDIQVRWLSSQHWMSIIISYLNIVT